MRRPRRSFRRLARHMKFSLILRKEKSMTNAAAIPSSPQPAAQEVRLTSEACPLDSPQVEWAETRGLSTSPTQMMFSVNSSALRIHLPPDLKMEMGMAWVEVFLGHLIWLIWRAGSAWAVGEWTEEEEDTATRRARTRSTRSMWRWKRSTMEPPNECESQRRFLTLLEELYRYIPTSFFFYFPYCLRFSYSSSNRLSCTSTLSTVPDSNI